MTLIVIAIILYLRSPQSAWAYALLKYTLIFLAGTVFPLLVLVSIALWNVYRQRKKEQDRVHKYASTDKAWVDFAAELGPTIVRFMGLMQEIGKETAKVNDRAQELIRAILIADPRRRLTQTSKGARTLNKNCLKMEIAAERLAAAQDNFFEVTEGYLKYVPPASQGNFDQLVLVRDSLKELEDSSTAVIETQEELMARSQDVYGKVSQDVNTSMNWMMAICKENVRIVEDFKARLARTLLPEVNRKLTS